MAQITRVTSEALQATIRRLLPSQQGFGEDLEASNVITPIIDLTPTAEGSSVPQMLQTALDFSTTVTVTIQTNNTIASTGGFYRVYGTCSMPTATSIDRICRIAIDDGTTVNNIWYLEVEATSAGTGIISESFDFVAFLRAGDSLRAFSEDADAVLATSVRQIADIGGNLVNPTGFTPQ